MWATRVSASYQGVTVTTVATVDVTPSRTAVAVIEAVPAPFAVTRPFASTVAIVASLVDQWIVRPATGLLEASKQVANSCTVGLVAKLNVAVAGEICTAATAGMTFTADEPVFVSAVATIEAGPPALTPVTVTVGPLLGETEANDGCALDQLMTRSVTIVPLTSRTVAVNCAVTPPVVTESDTGATVTLPTGAIVDTIDTAAVFPSLVALMFAEPAATAVTSPVALTVAAAVLSDCHVTTRPDNVAPVESLVIAPSCIV